MVQGLGTAAVSDGKAQRNEERREGRKAGGGGRINKVYKEDGKGKEGIMEGVKLMGKGRKGQTEKEGRKKKRGRKSWFTPACFYCLFVCLFIETGIKLLCWLLKIHPVIGDPVTVSTPFF